MDAQHSSLLLWVPLFPLLGAVINGLFGVRLQRAFGPRAIHAIAIAMPAIAAALSWLLFFQLLGLEPERRALSQVGWRWLNVGWVDASFAFWLDPLSSMMTLIITTIGTMIHVYAVGYMRGEPSYWRFFAYLNLFVTMMLVLVLGDNFLVMFIGWEGVGLASYLLIGFWYKDLRNAAAGMKAFVVNRFGDACFVVGLFALFWGLQGSWTGELSGERAYARDVRAAQGEDAVPLIGTGAVTRSGEGELLERPAATLTFHRLRRIFDEEVQRESLRLEQGALGLHSFDEDRGRETFLNKRLFGLPLIFVVCLLFFLGATAKSAQIPFYVWLPDAMAGPTPVSALIHAATMVTAGVYMIARLNFLFSLSPEACTVVAMVGALTALFAASMGLFQYDIKKVLAYSTVSQLGFMFVGVGVGAYWAGLFHLLTHACFKACLFLGSGSVILGCHHEQDMRRMGGLGKLMPSTRWTYALACFAIAGFPLAAGFCSKDEILWKAFSSSAVHGLLPGANYLIWGFSLLAAAFTAFYMYRSYYLTFTGEYRGSDAPAPDLYPADTARAEALLQPEPVPGPSPELLASLAAHGEHHAAGEAHAHHGADHDHHEHEHHGGAPQESPRSMTWPLWILGAASIGIGVVVGFPPVVASLLGLELHPALEVWLEPVLRPGNTMMALYATHTPAARWLADPSATHAFEYALAALSVLVALGGWLAARWLYRDAKNPLPAQLLERGGAVRAVHRLVYNKYFVDEAYYTVMVRGLARVWSGLARLDVVVVDGAVNAAGTVGRACGYVQGAIDTYLVDGAVNGVATLVMGAGRRLQRIQTGQLRTYLLGAFGGAVAAVLLVLALT